MSPAAPAREWRGFHLFYHGDRDRVLAEVVRPLAGALRADGMVERFFCIRYPLGGPHVRLRLEVDGRDASAVAARVRETAEAFFARRPSTEPVPAERIRRENRGIIASDPFASEADDVVFGDNSVVEFPVHFEVERYGGPGVFGHSLDFFVCSTLEALRFVESESGRGAGLRTARAARLLVRQAWGHAEDAADFARLVHYGAEMFGAPLARLLPVADAAFERGRRAMCALVRDELSALARGDGGGAEPARALRAATRGVPEAARRTITVSQMHMTANRLGLLNPDEVYLCRMLSRALEEIEAAEPGFWESVWTAHRERRDTPMPRLSEQVSATLVEFGSPTPQSRV